MSTTTTTDTHTLHPGAGTAAPADTPAHAPHQVTVRYFASLREALGQGSETLQTRAATVGALRAELVARGGAYAECLAQGRAVRMAVNQDLCRENDALPAGAEVAFFPPVTGG